MSDLIVITPSRGRPRQLDDLKKAIDDTTAGRARLLAAVDLDDPAYREYMALPWGGAIWDGPRRTLSEWTNWIAKLVTRPDAAEGGWADTPPKYLASMGDDHLPRTQDWDLKLADAIEGLGGHGWAYGNDLFQGRQLATAWACSVSTVRALGWMMLPVCQHMYVDNAIMELGRETGLLAYRPDVVIEHRHPDAGKAARDASYQETNSPMRYAEDGTAFAVWKASGMREDVAKVVNYQAG